MDISQNEQNLAAGGNFPPKQKDPHPLLCLFGGSVMGSGLSGGVWLWAVVGALVALALGEWAKRHDNKVRARKISGG